MSGPERSDPETSRRRTAAAASRASEGISTDRDGDVGGGEPNEPLDPDQQAVVASAARHLLVLAGAGTGKTRALVHRVAKLLADGVPPADILLLTFTRKAAATMRERLRALAVRTASHDEWGTDPTPPNVEIGTFHATAWRRVRASRDTVALIRGELPASDPATSRPAPVHAPSSSAPSSSAWMDDDATGTPTPLLLLAPDDAALALDEVLARPELRDDTEAHRALSVLGKRGDRQRALAARLLPKHTWPLELPLPAAADAASPTVYAPGARTPSPRGPEPTLPLFREATGDGRPDDPVERIRLAWTRAQRERGCVALDDLVAWWWHAIEAGFTPSPAHVLVDEIQDLDPLQWAIVASLAARAESVTLVGDLAQSIYGFRGAVPPRLDELRRVLPELELVTLRHNYRSYGPLVALGNAARTDGVRCVPTRDGHTTPVVVQLRDALQQAEFVAQRCEELASGGRAWSDLAVLARTRAELVDVARELASRGLPFRIRDERELDADSTGNVAPAQDGIAIELTTVHRAKGLEWPVVFVVGLVEGRFPLWGSDADPHSRDEEARLFHVAVTRARDELYLTHPAVDATSGLRALTASRFLRRLERRDASDPPLLQRWDVEEAPRD